MESIPVENGGLPVAVPENEAIIRRLNDEVLNAGNPAAVEGILDPDHVLYYPLLPEPMRGAQQWGQTVVNYFTAFPDMKITIEDMISDRDMVVARWSAIGTHKGDLLGIPPTNKTVHWSGVGIYRIRNGLILEQWGMDDQLGLMQRLGVIPTPGQG
jgi:steroid delta-isomerase-like uncharacterized protein